MHQTLSKSTAVVPSLDADSSLQLQIQQSLNVPRPSTPSACPDIRGRHRRQVELNRLNKEISMLEEELQLLESLPSASKCCKEFVEFTETRADPLLPFVTRGRATSSWDRWFKEHSADSDCRCCSLRHLKIWRFSCWKFSCRQACRIIPSFNCYKCSCIECFCFGHVKCCPWCRKK